MAVVQTLRPIGTATSGDARPANVLRIAEFLGPISPELVLVDPKLAPRARALLPELAWNWQPGAREAAEPIALRFVEVPAPTGRRSWRLAVGCAVAAAAAASFGLGVTVATSNSGETAAVGSRSPVGTPVVSPVQTPAAPAQPKPKSKPASRQARPVPTPPRFVWPAVASAKAYRVALYRGGKQVFERDVTSAGIQLSSNWTYRGRFYGLERGTYRWVVWPLVGKRPNTSQGPAIVSARYVV